MWSLLAEATSYVYTITTIQLVYRHTHTHRRLFGALSLLLCCCGTATTILHGCCCSTPSFFVELTRVVPPPCAVWLPFRRPPSHRRRQRTRFGAVVEVHAVVTWTQTETNGTKTSRTHPVEPWTPQTVNTASQPRLASFIVYYTPGYSAWPQHWGRPTCLCTTLL